MGKMLKTKVLSGLVWQFAERCGAQLVSFIVSILLARLLEPSAYGSISLVLVFTSILNVFIDSGMGKALVQKKDADDLDFSSVFFYNLGLGVMLYILVFFAAPYIARFYEDATLTSIIRVLSLTLVISGIRNVQNAYVSKNMYFKKFFFSTLVGTIGAAIVGIALAYRGYGVWALVAQQLTNTVIDTLVLWCTVGWKPQVQFSINRLKQLLGYGSKLLLAKLIDTIYNDLTQLLIGKFYSTSDLAFYNRGQQFPNLIITNINSSIDSVLLPTMAMEQDDLRVVKRMTQRAIQVSSFIMWPLMIGLAVVADSLVRLVLTDKWVECIPFLRIFCFVFVLYPVHTANLNAIKALGKSDTFLKLEVIKKIVGVSLILLFIPYGVYGIAFSVLIASMICTFINSFPNRKYLDYSYIEQIKDIIPFAIMAIIMGIMIYPIKYFEWGMFTTLVLQVFCGAAIYILEAKLLKIEAYEYILNIVSTYLKK